MNVELPDGTTIEDVPEGTTRAQIAAKLQAGGRAVPKEWLAPPPEPRKTLSGFVPQREATDAGLALASGAVAPVVGGLAGIVGSLVPGPAYQGADWAEKTQQALTYQPRTAVGEGAVGAISYPFEKLAQGADVAGGATAEATGSPLAGAAVNAGIQSLPMLLGMGSKKVLPGGESPAALAKRQAAQVTGAQTDAAAAKARAAGYALPPTQVSPSGINSALEGFGGKIKTAQRLSEDNQPRTNQLVRDEFGLPPDAPLIPKTLQEVRTRAAQEGYEPLRSEGRLNTDGEFRSELRDIVEPYRNAAADFPELARRDILRAARGLDVPSFDVSSALDQMRVLRERADTAYAAGDGALGRTYKRLSGAIEDQVGRYLEYVQAPWDMIEKFRNARQTIAKTYTVEKALRQATGNVDAKKLAGRLGKDPLSGNLLTIAEFAQAFPKAAQVTDRIGGVPMSPLDMAFAVGKGGVAGLLPFTRPFARNVLASDVYQNRFVRPDEYGPSLGSRLIGAHQNALLPLAEMGEGQ